MFVVSGVNGWAHAHQNVGMVLTPFWRWLPHVMLYNTRACIHSIRGVRHCPCVQTEIVLDCACWYKKDCTHNRMTGLCIHIVCACCSVIIDVPGLQQMLDKQRQASVEDKKAKSCHKDAGLCDCKYYKHSPLDFPPVVPNTHVPEHDTPIPSCSSKKVAFPACWLGCSSLCSLDITVHLSTIIDSLAGLAQILLMRSQGSSWCKATGALDNIEQPIIVHSAMGHKTLVTL